VVQKDVGQFVFEGIRVVARREVPVNGPVGDGADTVDHGARALARGRVQLSAEVLLRDDVGRVLRQLLGNSTLRCSKALGRRVHASVAVSIHRVEGVRAGRSEETGDAERLAQHDVSVVGDCDVFSIGWLPALLLLGGRRVCARSDKMFHGVNYCKTWLSLAKR